MCKTLKLESLRLIVGFATSVMVVDWGLVSVQKREWYWNHNSPPCIKMYQGSGLHEGRSSLSELLRRTKIGQGLWLQPSTADDGLILYTSLHTTNAIGTTFLSQTKGGDQYPKKLFWSLTHRVCEIVQQSGLLSLLHGLPPCAPYTALGETLTSACESWTHDTCC